MEVTKRVSIIMKDPKL
jgi:hypothetical protein